MGGVLALLPAGLAGSGTQTWTSTAPAEQNRPAGLVQGVPPEMLQISVDGQLPQPPQPVPPEALPSGPLGIPGSALKAYRNAADLMRPERPGCHLDWALVASIGRIESNHARGGYVDAKGNTREPILGPELNGVGPVAAIRDTDHGRWDHDTVWDRAVGPTQFIPSTWAFYGADGNHDRVADPNNIYDATFATAGYLCSGGLDLGNPAQLRAAIYRYNNSDAYVETVIRWAEAYRSGVAPLPDSKVPVGAPSVPAAPAAPVAPPPPPTVLAAPPAATTPLPSQPPARSDGSSAPTTTTTPSTSPTTPGTTTTTTTTPATTTTTPTTTTTTTTTTVPPACATATTPTSTTTTTTTTPTSPSPSPCEPPVTGPATSTTGSPTGHTP
nr:lytic murein transglycosylase [Amycolatopsis granulosa]